MKHQESLLFVGSIALGLWSACSSNVVTNASSTVGASGNGDVETSTGGKASAAGSAGRNSVGGASVTTSGGNGDGGRSTGTSGATANAGQGAAATNIGGANSGGAGVVGGASANGGAGVVGGASANGGATGVVTGGASSNVGGAANGGRPATGGAATGGAATGGKATGGAATGGAATGGSATGGAATGGAATGGAATGGAATGGAATGGAPATETVVYSFYDHLCEGDWVAASSSATGASPVQCGLAGANPSVTKLAVAALQGGAAGQRVIRLQPYAAAEGLTSGYFAGLSLIGVANPVFVTDIACPSGATSCAVDWQIYGRLPGTTGAPAALQNGSQSFTGATATLRLSLAACANLGVDMAISVDAGGSYSPDDVLLLVNPRIINAP